MSLKQVEISVSFLMIFFATLDHYLVNPPAYYGVLEGLKRIARNQHGMCEGDISSLIRQRDQLREL